MSAPRRPYTVKLLLNKSPNRHEGTHRRSLAYVFPGISHVYSSECVEGEFSEVRVAGLSPKSLDVVPKRMPCYEECKLCWRGAHVERSGRPDLRAVLSVAGSRGGWVLWLVGAVLAATSALVVYLGVLGVVRTLAGA